MYVLLRAMCNLSGCCHCSSTSVVKQQSLVCTGWHQTTSAAAALANAPPAACTAALASLRKVQQHRASQVYAPESQSPQEAAPSAAAGAAAKRPEGTAAMPVTELPTPNGGSNDSCSAIGSGLFALQEPKEGNFQIRLAAAEMGEQRQVSEIDACADYDSGFANPAAPQLLARCCGSLEVAVKVRTILVMVLLKTSGRPPCLPCSASDICLWLVSQHRCVGIASYNSGRV